MEAASLLDNFRGGWARRPDALSVGPAADTVVAALWASDADAPEEVWAEANDTHHILIFPIRPQSAATWHDGRIAYDVLHRPYSTHMIPAGVTPRAVIGGAYEIMHVLLPRGLIERVLAQTEQAPAAGAVELIDPACTFDPQLARIAQQIRNELTSESLLSDLRVDILSQDIVVHLLRRWSNFGPAVSDRGGLAPWQVKRVTELLEADLARDVSLADLAKVANVSIWHVSRGFRQSTGYSPLQWLRVRRMERARDLLERTTKPVAEIAAAVGFDSASAFAAAFRRHVGATATAYRRERGLG